MEMTTNVNVQELEATYRALQVQATELMNEDKALDARIQDAYNRMDAATDAGDNEAWGKIDEEITSLEAERRVHGRKTNSALLAANKAVRAWKDAQ